MTNRVLIAGGGPVGAVTVFEAVAQVNDGPRAATTDCVTLEFQAGLGITDEVIARGLTARKFQFRDRGSGEPIAEFNHELLREDTRSPYAVQFEQDKLARLALERLRELPGSEIHYSARVADVDAFSDGVAVTVEMNGGARTFRGAFLVGTDGGRSTMRKCLGIEFEGYTWPERFIVLTRHFDFEGEGGNCYRNYLSDPDEWANLFNIAGDDDKGQWRVVFPTRAGETDQGAISEAGGQERLQRFFPKPAPYPAVRAASFEDFRATAADPARHRSFLLRTSLIESVRKGALIK